MGRKNILPLKGLISEALSLTSLLLAEGDGDKGAQGTINIIGVFNNTFIKVVLVKIQY